MMLMQREARFGPLGAGVLAVVVVALPLAAAAGQEPGATVVGTVSHATTGEPLGGVRVAVAGRAIATQTDGWGEFHLANLPADAYELLLERDGFAPRGFRFDLSDRHLGEELYLGVFSLTPMAAPVAAAPAAETYPAWGRVVNAVTGAPIPGVIVGMDQQAMRVTGPDGEFRIDGLVGGRHVFKLRRIGFRPANYPLFVSESQPAAPVSLTLEPLPVAVDEIVVEGERTIFAFGRMAGFYRRRQTGQGVTFTREEIAARNPIFMSDMLRQVPAVRLTQRPDGSSNVEIRNCGPPTIYLDGLPVAATIPIDDLVTQETVEALEVYVGANIPAEFSTSVAGSPRAGQAPCGVVVVWLR